MQNTQGNRLEILKGELEDAIRKRERLDAVIEYLSDELGISSPSAGPLFGPPVEAVSPSSSPAESVREGQFHGKSATASAKALLEKFGPDRPLKTQELFEAITKGGVGVANPDTLYRSLHRDKRFQRVGRSLWGLSAWYPEGTRKTKAAEGQSSTSDNNQDDIEDDETPF